MHARRNVAVLFIAQAVLGAQMPVHIILGGLAGVLLAENKALATLPISIVVLVSMFTAPVASLIMGRYGRRFGFLLGALAGAGGGALSAYALLAGSFEMLVLGAALAGIYQSFQGFFRFAAVDTAPEEFKPKAISWVMAGGLVSALIGPEIVQLAGDALAPTPFAGAYAALVAVNVVGAAALAFLRIPVPPRRTAGMDTGRPLAVIFREPKVIVAVLCAMISFAIMNLVMTSTPLAMVTHGYSSDHAADVVRWHVVAMFAPSFFTGSLIARTGVLRVIAVGLVLLGVCAAIAVSGVELHRFYAALVVLGIGWNFAFVGATSLLATTHSAAERAKVQGFNDFLIFGLVSIASFSSGALLNSYGWNAVQIAVLPGLAVGLLTLAWLWLSSVGATFSRDSSKDRD
jgi:predicted MFS family arabinose efflux permease